MKSVWSRAGGGPDPSSLSSIPSLLHTSSNNGVLHTRCTLFCLTPNLVFGLLLAPALLLPSCPDGFLYSVAPEHKANAAALTTGTSLHISNENTGQKVQEYKRQQPVVGTVKQEVDHNRQESKGRMHQTGVDSWVSHNAFLLSQRQQQWGK